MKLSVFTKPKHLPTKEEKAIEARYTSKPYSPELRNFVTEDDLIDLVTNYVWSPFTYKEYRREADFISTDLLVYDIDEGMKIEEAEEVVRQLELTCLALPTTSHTEEEHRFRLIFPLSRTIVDREEYKATYNKYAEYFTTDPACRDLGRFFFGSTMNAGFYLDGKLLTPVRTEKPRNSVRREFDPNIRVDVGESLEELVEALFEEKRDTIPENIAYWLENAPSGLSGEWHNICNSAIFTLGLMQIPIEMVEEVFRKIAPDDLDKHDEYLLERAWQDGYNSRG